MFLTFFGFQTFGGISSFDSSGGSYSEFSVFESYIQQQDTFLRVVSVDKMDLAAGEVSKMKQHIVPQICHQTYSSFL